VRVVFSNNKKGINEYKISSDFQSTEDINGIKFPVNYYQADIGLGATARGAELMYKNIQINLELEKDFFEKAKANFGAKIIKSDIIEGNATSGSFNTARNYGTIITNLLPADVEQANISSKDKILIDYAGEKKSGIYVRSTDEITSEMIASENIIAAGADNYPYLVILFFGKNMKPEIDKFKALMNIKIEKKKKGE
jgi:hypothetical protein